METFAAKIFKSWKIYLLILIIGVGIFLRVYHFSGWLHFEIDQTYDIRLVTPAADNGISNLPLLGPTVGGGRSLRLGPAVYYLNYLSAKFFGNTPTGHASLILVLSLFSLPLFYLVCRRYFSVYLSIGLLAIFSFSSYLVLYSRFSWSPNYLPFFMLLFLLALLRSVSKAEKNPDRWFIFAIFIFSIITQIHFNAFFVMPAVLLVFLILKRPHFHWKTWVFSVAIFLAVYSPIIVSDAYNHGENFKYFLEKMGLNSSGSGEKGKSLNAAKITGKLLENFRYNSLEYFLIISGKDSINTSRFARDSFGLVCKSCKDDFLIRLSGYLFFILFPLVLIRNIYKEKDGEKKNFLILSGLLFVFSFLYYFSISYDGYNIYPRFFLLVAPLAVIFFGFVLEKIQPEKDMFRLIIFAAIIIVFSFFNLQRLRSNFLQLGKSETEKIRVETEDIFPDNARITLNQQKDIMGYIQSKYTQNKFPVYIYSIHEYAPSFWYFLDRANIPFDEISENDVYGEGNYFLILPSYKLSSKDTDKYESKFYIDESKDFGTLKVFYLAAKPEAITSEKEDMANKKPTLQSQQVSEILTWKKLFSK